MVSLAYNLKRILVYALISFCGCAIGSKLVAQDVTADLVEITLVDKNQIEIRIHIKNHSAQPILYDPKIYPAIAEQGGLPARIPWGMYRAIVTIFPPQADNGVPVIREQWAGITKEGEIPPPIQIKPGEETKSSIQLEINSMLGVDFFSSIIKGVQMQVALQHCDVTTTSLKTKSSSRYKLLPLKTGSKEIHFIPSENQEKK